MTWIKVNIKVMLYLEGTACFVSRPKSKLKMGMGSDRALKWPFLASIWLIWLSCKSWRARVLAPEPLCSSGTLIKSWPISCKPFHFEHKSLETTWAKTRPEWGITRQSWKKDQINQLWLNENISYFYFFIKGMKKDRKKDYRSWQDSNLQSSDPKSDALSIRPHDPYMILQLDKYDSKLELWWNYIKKTCSLYRK